VFTPIRTTDGLQYMNMSASSSPTTILKTATSAVPTAVSGNAGLFSGDGVHVNFSAYFTPQAPIPLALEVSQACAIELVTSSSNLYLLQTW
jgi:hypothetical protein